MPNQPEKLKETKNNLIGEKETIEECFIITPIGAPGSEIFSKAMGLIDAVIDPVLSKMGMRAMPANRMQDLGSINKQLIKRVIEDRLVIANLTGLNPNVMYELAIRHGARKPVIIMAEEGTRLPFDINDQRTIFYSDTYSGVEKAKEELRLKINFAIEDDTPDNPIYSYLDSAKLFREMDNDNPLKLILEKVEELTARSSSTNDRMYLNSSKSYSEIKNTKGGVFTFKGNFDTSYLHKEHPKAGVSITTINYEIRKAIEMFLMPYSKEYISLSSSSYSSSGAFQFSIYSESSTILNSFLDELEKDNRFSNIQEI
jgi:hypothetical protein